MPTKKAAVKNNGTTNEDITVENQVEPQTDEAKVNETKTEEIVYPERSEPVTVGPREGGNALLQKWDGIFNVLGGRVEQWDVTPEGVVAVNFTVDGHYDPLQIIADLQISDRQRLYLVPAYFYLNGQDPEPFATALDMTKWMQGSFKKIKTDDGDRSPEYVKKAIAEYKKANAFPARKGRPRKIIRVENLGSIDDTVLAGVDVSELQKLQEKIAHALSTQAATAEAATAAASQS